MLVYLISLTVRCQAHNSAYMLRSSLPLVAAVLGLRHIFSAPSFATLGLFGVEKTAHSRGRLIFNKVLKSSKWFISFYPQ